MIALVMGIVIGIPIALIMERLLGKANGTLIAIMGIPLITYAIALHELGMFTGLNASIEGFSPEFIAGTETFLGLIVALAYVELRTREGLSIDDFIQTSITLLPYVSLAIALAFQFWPGFLAAGMTLVALMAVSSLRNPLKGLRVNPCPPDFGDCLTDENSLMSVIVGGRILVGGRVLREFPRAGELIECMKRAKGISPMRKVIGFLVSLVPLGAIMLPPGEVTVAVGLATAYVSTLAAAAMLTKGRTIPCPEINEEYRKFLKERKRKIDVAV